MKLYTPDVENTLIQHLQQGLESLDFSIYHAPAKQFSSVFVSRGSPYETVTFPNKKTTGVNGNLKFTAQNAWDGYFLGTSESYGFGLSNNKSVNVKINAQGVLQLWDGKTNKLLYDLKGHTDKVTAFKSLGYSQIISASADKTLKVWDLESGKCLQTIQTNSGVVSQLGLVNGYLVTAILSGGGHGLQVWDLTPTLTYQNVATLFKAIMAPQNTLKALSLKNVELGETGFNALLNLIQTHLHLRYLILENCKLSPAQEQALKATLLEVKEKTERMIYVDIFENLYLLPPKIALLSKWEQISLLSKINKDAAMEPFLFPVTNKILEPLFSSEVAPTILYTPEEENNLLRLLKQNSLSRLDFSSYHTSPKAIKILRGPPFFILKNYSDRVFLLANQILIATNEYAMWGWNYETQEPFSILNGHSGRVTAIVLLLDGTLVSASEDKTIKIWDPRRGYCLKTLTGHTSSVESLVVLPDGQLLSGGSDQTLKIWSPETGHCLKTLKGHTSAVQSVVVMSTGQIISGSRDKTVKVWDPHTGQCLRTLSGHTDWVNCIAILSNEEVITASRDKTVKVWNTETGECLKTLVGDTQSVNRIFVFKGHIVSGASYNTNVWNSNTGECLRTFDEKIPFFSDPHEHLILIKQMWGGWANLEVWDLSPALVYDQVAGVLTALVTTPNHLREISLKGIQLGEAGCETLLKLIQEHRHLERLMLAECGLTLEQEQQLKLALMDVQEKTGRKIDVDIFPDLYRPFSNIISIPHLPSLPSFNNLPENQPIHQLSHNALQTLNFSDYPPSPARILKRFEGHIGWVNGLVVLPQGEVVSVSEDHTIKAWNPETGQCIQTLLGHTSSVRCVAVLDNMKVITASADKTLKFWDLQSGQCLQNFTGHTSVVTSVAALGPYSVVSASYDSTLKVWNLQSGQCLQTLKGHTGGVLGVAVLTDGHVVSVSCDKTIRIWNPETGQCLKIFSGHTDVINSVVLLRNGHFVTSSCDKTIKIWNPETGQCLRTLKGHTDYVYAVAVLNNEEVVSASTDKTIKLWNLETGQCVQTLNGHANSVNGVAVLSTGHIISASDDNTLGLWDLKVKISPSLLPVGILDTDTVLSADVRPSSRVVSDGFSNKKQGVLFSYESILQEDGQNCFRVKLNYLKLTASQSSNLQNKLKEFMNSGAYVEPEQGIQNVTPKGYLKYLDFDDEEAAEQVVEELGEFLSLPASNISSAYSLSTQPDTNYSNPSNPSLFAMNKLTTHGQNPSNNNKNQLDKKAFFQPSRNDHHESAKQRSALTALLGVTVAVASTVVMTTNSEESLTGMCRLM